MKKIQLNTAKLKLKKETIASLTNEETKAIYGGGGPVSADTTDTETGFLSIGEACSRRNTCKRFQTQTMSCDQSI